MAPDQIGPSARAGRSDGAEGIELTQNRQEATSGGRQGLDRSRRRQGDENEGMTPFLLKFGEGMGECHGPLISRGVDPSAEEVSRSRLWISALTIGFSYFIGGLIPLVPYMAHTSTRIGLIVSAVVTGVVLLIFGAFKTYFTGAKGGWKGYMYGSISTFVVGAVGAGAAYGLVRAMHVRD